MADTVQIDIRAIVRGIQDVRNLVREIERLPDAGLRLGTLNAQFKTLQSELSRVATATRDAARESQANFGKVEASAARVPGVLRNVTKEADNTSKGVANAATNISAIGRSVEQAFRGNILESLRTIGTVLRTSFDFTRAEKGAEQVVKVDKAAVAAEKAISKLSASTGVSKALIGEYGKAAELAGGNLNNAGILVTRFSALIGSAAKNMEGALAKNLLNDFGIDAAAALTNPTQALDKFVTTLNKLPDAQTRAIALSNLFGSSTAKLIPVTEGYAIAQATAATATTATGVAQGTTAVATNALAGAQTTAAGAASTMAAAETTAAVATGGLAAAVGSVLVVIGIALAVLAAVTAGFFYLAKSTSDAGGELFDLSQKTGLAVEDLSALKLAAEQAGSTLETATGSIVKYLRNTNDAAGGNKKLQASFKELGIDVDKVSGDSSAALQALFVAISKLPPGAQQIDAAMTLAGKSGADLIPIINQANGDFAAFRAEAEKLGAVMSGETAQASDDFGDALVALQAAFTGLKNQIGGEILPTFTELILSITDFVRTNRQGFSDFASVVSTAFKVVLTIFYAFGGTVAFLTNLVYGLLLAGEALANMLNNTVASVISYGKALVQFYAGDVTGAFNTAMRAAQQTRTATNQLIADLKVAGGIIAQPTFTSAFALWSGGGNKPAPAPKLPATSTFRGGGGGGKRNNEADQIRRAQEDLEKARLEAETNLLRDELKRQQTILKQHYAQNLIATGAYYTELETLQLKDIEVQLAQQRKLLTMLEARRLAEKKLADRLKVDAEIIRANEKITVLERQRADVTRDANFEAVKAAKEYAKALQNVQNQLNDIAGRKSDVAKARVDEQFREDLEKAEARAHERGIDPANDPDVIRINLLKAQLVQLAKFEELQDRIKIIEGARNLLNTELQQQVALGQLTQAEANEKLVDFETRQRDVIGDILPGLQKIADSIGSPQLQQAVAEVRNQLQQWRVDAGTRSVDEIRTAIEQVEAAREIADTRTEQRLAANQIGERQAHQERLQHAAEYVEQMNILLAELEAIAVATNNTGLQQYVDKARASLIGLGEDSDTLGIQINKGFIGSFQNLLQDLASGTKTVGEAFASMGANILKILTDIAIKILLTKLLLKAFGGDNFTGGIGGALSGLFGGSNAVAGGFDSGGLFRGKGGRDANTINITDGEFVVNAEATKRNLATLYAINDSINPQRNFNAGGQVAAAPGGGNGQQMPRLNIVNVLPNDLLENYITTGDGALSLLNFIENNSGAINTRLGNKAA